MTTGAVRAAIGSVELNRKPMSGEGTEVETDTSPENLRRVGHVKQLQWVH